MGNQSKQPLRILLADDDADVRETIKLVLGMERHKVVEACDGVEALELASTSHFDLIITDYVMPRMSGDLLALEIKKKSPRQPIIMITANADLLPNPLSGVDQVLAKPFQVAELLRAIREI